MKPRFPPLRSSIFRRLLIGLGAVVVLLLLCYGGYKYIERPRYIDLSIPSPSSDLPRGDWSYTEYTTRVWNDSGAKYFILRREDYLHSSNFYGQKYRTWEEVLAYFDDWLLEHNWERYQVPLDDPCKNILPESEFLPRGREGYEIYRQIGSTPFMDEPTVCLAIWQFPASLDNASNVSYHVVLIGANPSTITGWNSQWSLP